MNLLERMLDPDEEARFTMHEVKEHPWFKRVLPEHLATALVELETAQARAAAGNCRR